MKTVIFTGGSIDKETVIEQMERIRPDAVIAADHGLGFCDSCGIVPDYIVGDFDSLDHRVIDRYRAEGKVPIDTFQPEKDMTDTDIALEKAIAIGSTEVFFFGATGTRLDHTISNIFNLYKLYDRGIQGWIIDRYNRISMPLGNRVVLKKAEVYGGNISMFPLRGELRGVTLHGFKYPLTDAVLVQGDGGLSVSNAVVEEEAEIIWQAGILILMETRD
ncbi:MAG: thiamine diphosphokinase [Eubacteriales bacterium]|nr:thiamine diphosphokinase [Eubacteriales bacterium]